MPLPAEGEAWDPHTIHTHYFGFSIPEAEIGAFIYVRYQPAFPLCGAGVSIFRGLDNVHPLDVEFHDYEVTMPWPELAGNAVTTANGLRLEFIEPGRTVRVSYTADDGAASFDVVQTAVTPMFARGHVLPGEEVNSDQALAPGGMEQLMHCTGELVLHGERYEIDCHEARDRSWSQLRTERRGAVNLPPLGWSPMYFGEDLAFNQIGFEPLDTDPAWKGLYEIPAGQRAHHYGWVSAGGSVRELATVRRNVLEYHPRTFAALRQELDAEDEGGRTYHFAGEAIAMAPVPAWPNVAAVISVYRWEDERGRPSIGTYQEVWFDVYQRAMANRAGLAGARG